MHKLLERQIKRYLGGIDKIPDEIQPLIEAIDEAYHGADHDHRLLERALDLASKELLAKNRELRAKANDLEQSNADLEQFAFVASHDLQSPLNAIENLSTWLEEDLGMNASDDTRKNLELLRSRVGRMKSYIKALLHLARAGRAQVAPERVGMGDLLEEIRALLPDTTIQIDLDAPDLELITPRVPLCEVLVNLIGNAIKHHDRKDGYISICVVEEEEFHKFSVTDDGPGIPIKHQERIFRMFETMKSRDQVESAGIGLAIVEKTVRAFGGRVWLSPTEDRGATFNFTWPKNWTAKT